MKRKTPRVAGVLPSQACLFGGHGGGERPGERVTVVRENLVGLLDQFEVAFDEGLTLPGVLGGGFGQAGLGFRQIS